MPKLNSTVKAVRIDNDKLAELEERLGGQTINSWLNEKITEYLGGKPEKSEKILEASPNRDMEEIESMARYFGISGENLLKMIYEGLNEGALTVENGKIVGTPDMNIEKFKDACHSAGVNPDKAFEKAIQAIRKGQI